ncbi:MAG: FKBP-type peptidyl-prolyl cis-trans isomerase [Treponema sp.]|nr:FKBP-type peptidyl-prolyl cis-trans isomerase [Treponema sp.]
MKKIFSFYAKALLVLLLCAALFSACNTRERPSPDALDRDTSYAFGMWVAAQTGFSGISFDYYAFMEGFRDFNEARETRLTMEEMMERIMAAVMAMDAEGAQDDEELWLLSQRNLEEGEAYMAANAQRPGVVTTASGLQYEVIAEGTGERPGVHDTVLVHYEGTFLDGTVFDSSFQRGQPIDFPLGMVIAGWVEGLQLMNVGSTYRFVIPAHLAYGPGGAGGPGGIPPNATLIFTVELLDIIR